MVLNTFISALNYQDSNHLVEQTTTKYHFKPALSFPASLFPAQLLSYIVTFRTSCLVAPQHPYPPFPLSSIESFFIPPLLFCLLPSHSCSAAILPALPPVLLSSLLLCSPFFLLSCPPSCSPTSPACSHLILCCLAAHNVHCKFPLILFLLACQILVF